MDDRIPCKECNELILTTTAQKTSGVCMACKQGIRQAIEQSREFYQKQKEYDPHRALWHFIVDKSDGERRGGFGSLTKEEKVYYAVVVFEGEVYNGGILQFFSNSSGELYSEVIDALAVLEAHQTIDLLKRGTELIFGDIDPPNDRVLRNDLMRDNDHGPVQEWERELDEIENQILDGPDNLLQKLERYAETTGLIRPFLKPEEE